MDKIVNFLKKHKLISTIFVVVLIMTFVSFFLYFTKVENYSSKKVITEISKGTNLRQIAHQLENAGVIRSENLFLVSVFLDGSQSRLRAGEYEFEKGIKQSEVIYKLVNGKVRLRKVTIPEGKNIYEISAILDDSEITDSDKFVQLAFDSSYASSKIGEEVSSLEGYLFPDTYFFPKGESVEDIIDLMVSRFKNTYQSLVGNYKTNRLTDHEIITLASMIEKETGFDSERKLISAVFHNRLRKGMRMECDPTVIYGIGPDFDGNIRKKDINTLTPYNTYRVSGLPPGPIANPGKNSIEAALNPSDVDYLFFVSKGDGRHVFSEDYKEHIRAVNRYIR